MKPIGKIATDYLVSGPVADVVVNVGSGLAGIAAHPLTYVTPEPPLATVQTALDALVTSIADAATGGPLQTAIRNANRIALAEFVRPLSSYVTTIANGDMAKLLSSGLPIQQPTRSPIGALSTPTAPVAKQGPVTGSFMAISSPVSGAGIYNWRLGLASAPTVYVQTAQTTGARNMFNGLTPGQIYNVQLNAVGAAGASDWSDDGSMMVT